MSDKSNEYPKTLTRKDGDYSIVLNEVRVYFDIVTANDASEEKALKKSGWCNGVEEAFKPKRKKAPKDDEKPIDIDSSHNEQAD